jgi:alpha-L-fucosidase 2
VSENQQPLELWYNKPAAFWEEALPLGNGSTGAMVYGGVEAEQYSLNDLTLWSGEPKEHYAANGPEILKNVREAIDAGDYGKAGELWKGMHGDYSARYLPLGDLYLNFDFPATRLKTISENSISGIQSQPFSSQKEILLIKESHS